ncbi:MAG: hypothetical protein GF383_10700 [Candidatus Lokiarchaeota archaeon]|nr:hypothetical protein [Candidatus Lokiarchaeota archaeon]MBD3341062.1 hypothetical protein [Candidatus Lokiarchaeota archaeon]
MGGTGAREAVAQITKDTIKNVKDKTKSSLLLLLPILVGFGISKLEHAKAIVEAGAIGVIMGSAIVKIIQKNINDFSRMEKEMQEFVMNIKKTLENI